jgi:hypothetical protein
MTAYSQREGVESDLDGEGAVVLADGRAFCISHIPADVCPDSDNHEHDWDYVEDPEATCSACGAERSSVDIPAGVPC